MAGEGLEVRHTTEKQIAQGYGGLEVFPGTNQRSYYQQAAEHASDNQHFRHNGMPNPLPDSRKESLPFNLRPLTFGLLIAAVTLIVVGGAVGGGVAAALSHKNQDTSNSTVSGAVSTTTIAITSGYASTTFSSLPSITTTSTAAPTATASTGNYANYTAPLPSTIDTVYVDCDNLNSSTLQSSLGDTYRIFCGIDMPGEQGWTTTTGLEIVDFASFTVYSFEDCLSACSNTNRLALPGQPKCEGVGFLTNMAFATENYLANCWLKNGTTPDGVGNPVTSAVIGKLMSG